MKVALIGASGNIGSQILSELRARGHDVTAIARNPEKIAAGAGIKPVRADVMLNGRKIAGAAQRRTRAGLLHQGSIQGFDLGNGLADRFAKGLSSSCNVRNLSAAVHDRAQKFATQKYGTQSWLRRR